MAEKAIRAILVGDGAVNALVSGRVYARTLPQNPKLPAVVYSRISGTRVESLQGASGLASPRFQIDVFAERYDEVKTLTRDIQLALEGKRGSFGGVDVQGILYQGDRDMTDDLTDNLTIDQHRVMMEFTIWHRE